MQTEPGLRELLCILRAALSLYPAPKALRLLRDQLTAPQAVDYNA